MKRFLILLLVISLVFALMPHSALVISAENTETATTINSIDITIPSNFGDTLSAGTIVVANGADCTLSAEIQRNWNNVDSCTIGYGEHFLLLTITPLNGYSFAQQPDITVNGITLQDCGWDIWSVDYAEDQIIIHMDLSIQPELGWVSNIRLFGLPESITAWEETLIPDNIRIGYVNNSNAEITVTNVEWVNAEYQRISGIFEDGKAYYLAITLQTGPDTPMRSAVQVDGIVGYDYHAESPDGITCTAYIRYSLQPKIDTVQVFVDEPVAGGVPGVPYVAEDANYTIVDYSWEYVYGTFHEGFQYDLRVELAPAEGYDFADTVTSTINSRACNKSLPADNLTHILISTTFSLVPPIDKIEISGLAMELGDTLSKDALQLPWDAHCTMEVSIFRDHWNAVDSCPLGYGLYDVWLQFYPDDQCVFDTNMTLEDITVNGIPISECGWTVADYSITADNISISLSRNIEPENGYVFNVDLAGLPDSIKPGENITFDGTVTVTGTDNDLADVTVTGAQWVDENYNAVTGTFEEGKVYYLAVSLETGMQVPLHRDIWINTNAGGVNAVSEDNFTCTAYIRYSLQYVIDEVYVTVAEPQVGKAPTRPSVAKDANYRISEYVWFDLTTGKKADKILDGHVYTLDITLKAKASYEFAELPLIYLNGEYFCESWETYSAYFVITYSFETPIMAGDIDGNGEIDLMDANLAVAFYNETADLTDDQLIRADVDGNGDVDLMDANLIVGYYNETVDRFPVDQ